MIYTNITDNDKELLKTNACAIKTKIIIKPLGEEDSIILTEDDYVKDWLYTDERYVPDEGFVGQFVARTLSGNLQNIDETFNIENRIIELRMGIVSLGATPTETWYSLGTFYVIKPEEDNVSDNTSFEAFDITTLFNQDFNYNYIDNEYEKSFATLCAEDTGMTALELAKYVCKQVGVEFGSESFTNSDFLITSNQFVSGDSCRDVMKAIAKLAYSWVFIDWDDKCYIPLINTDYTGDIDGYDIITTDEYFELTMQKEIYGPVNNIRLGLSAVTDTVPVDMADDDSIAENGETRIEVLDNPITYTDALREQAKTEASVLWGLEYTPLEVETIGHPWFKAYNRICVMDTNGTGRYMYPFNLEINYTGHIRTTITSPADTESQSNIGYNKTVYKDIRDVKIVLDKQNGEIKILNESKTALEGQIGELTKQVNTKITDTYSRTEINEIISGTSPDGTVVSSVKTTAGTLDKDGLTIEQTGADTKTNINANGMIIYDATGGINDAMLTVNSTGVVAKNVRVETYLNIGEHSRIEDYVHTDYTEGTGVFWIGGD